MSTTRFGRLLSRLSSGYKTAKDCVIWVATSPVYERAKTYVNIVVSASMAVGYFASIGKPSDDDSNFLPSPAEYIVTSAVSLLLSCWEYKRGSSTHTIVKILNDSENTINHVARGYSRVITQVKEENKALQLEYQLESKSIPLISKEYVLAPPSISQRFFNSRPAVCLRAIVNGSVVATTISQYMSSSWIKDFFLSGSLVGASCWFYHDIQASIAREFQFDVIKAKFPIATKQLHFMDRLIRHSKLANTIAQIAAANSDIKIPVVPTAYETTLSIPNHNKFMHAVRAVVKSASQARSMGMLSRSLFPGAEPIIAGGMFLMGMPRAYKKYSSLAVWNDELSQFKKKMDVTLPSIRRIESVLDLGARVLEVSPLAEVSSSAEEDDDDDNENKSLLADFDDMSDLELGLSKQPTVSA